VLGQARRAYGESFAVASASATAGTYLVLQHATATGTCHGNTETIFFPTARVERVYTGKPKLFVGSVDVRAAPMLGCNA
jgi:hypothetical protein